MEPSHQKYTYFWTLNIYTVLRQIMLLACIAVESLHMFIYMYVDFSVFDKFIPLNIYNNFRSHVVKTMLGKVRDYCN
jgi:hypothetical protein